MCDNGGTRSQQEFVEVSFFCKAILRVIQKEFEVLESSEQSLRAVISSTDLSAVNDEGSDMEVVIIGLAVMSCALAVASARNTVQSGT